MSVQTESKLAHPPSIVLDLGCGQAKVPGAIGVDNVSLQGVDVVHDLLDIPFPFESGSATEVYLNHVIEHFSLPNIQQILREVYRLLKPGGIAHIRVPHVYSVAAWVDPTHKTAFTFATAHFFEVKAAKAYYKETENCWELVATSARVTWFNWKRYRMRQLDTLLGRCIAGWLNWLLKQPNLPGSADLLVKLLPLFFVEIQWQLRKPVSF